MNARTDLPTLRRWLKICSLIMAVLMFRVWESVQAQRLDHQLKALRAEADRLTYENGHLQMQIHQYEAPSSLEALAKSKFSMGPLDAAHRVMIEP